MFRGFFNRMYQGNPNRPDLEPEDMPRNKFELFTTTLGVRFGDLFKLNLLFVVFILPLLAWTALNYLSLMSFPIEGDAIDTAAFIETATQVLFNYVIGLVPCLILAGPPIAGLTYVARNWARDEHAWLWSDFKEHALKNWKQAAAVMLIMGLAIVASFYVLNSYSLLIATTGSTMVFFMRTIFIILAALFFMSYLYVFPLMVTYDLRLGQLLRNSFALALGRLPFTILFTVLTLLPLAIAVPLYAVTVWAMPVLVLFYLLLGFSLAAFTNNSYTNATFGRFMTPADKDQNQPADPPTEED